MKLNVGGFEFNGLYYLCRNHSAIGYFYTEEVSLLETKIEQDTLLF